MEAPLLLLLALLMEPLLSQGSEQVLLPELGLPREHPQRRLMGKALSLLRALELLLERPQFLAS
jgi:hypothetical protein